MQQSRIANDIRSTDLKQKFFCIIKEKIDGTDNELRIWIWLLYQVLQDYALRSDEIADAYRRLLDSGFIVDKDKIEKIFNEGVERY